MPDDGADEEPEVGHFLAGRHLSAGGGGNSGQCVRLLVYRVGDKITISRQGMDSADKIDNIFIIPKKREEGALRRRTRSSNLLTKKKN